MLVLTRRVDESIMIGETIVVTILGIEGDRVKVGITAPRDVKIMRQEMFEAVRDQDHIQEILAGSSEPQGFEELRRLLSSDQPEDPAAKENDASDQASDR